MANTKHSVYYAVAFAHSSPYAALSSFAGVNELILYTAGLKSQCKYPTSTPFMYSYSAV